MQIWAAARANGQRSRSRSYRSAPRLYSLLLVTVAAICTLGPARGEDHSGNLRTTFGETGMLEMPSARMASDGTFGVTVGVLQGMQRYNLWFQALPWLDVSFRYAHITNYRNLSSYYDRSFGLKIRLSRESEDMPELSLGLRDMLGTGVYSGEYLVASKRYADLDLSMGMGWGRFGQSDALNNPFAQIFSSFKTRADSSANGGNVNFGQLFHGPKVGLFGGAIWHTPVEGLDAIAEYSSDRYLNEQAYGSIKIRSPVNLGLAYHAFDLLTVSASWLYGTTYGLTLSLSADPTMPTSPQKLGPEIPAPVFRTGDERARALTALLRGAARPVTLQSAMPWITVPQSPSYADDLAAKAAFRSVVPNVRDVDIVGRTLVIDASLSSPSAAECNSYARSAAAIDSHIKSIAVSDSKDDSGRVTICEVAMAGSEPRVAPDDRAADGNASARIAAGIAGQGLKLEALSIESSTAYAYFSNSRYAMDTEAAGRVARVLMANAPSSTEVFHLVVVRDGLPQRDFEVARSALERAVVNHGSPIELGQALAAVSPPLHNPVLDAAFDDSYPRYRWDISPALREGFFDPERPLQFQIYAAANLDIDVTPKLSLQIRGEANIADSYDTGQPSNSLLPHVRSDVFEYLKDGINGISHLRAVYRSRLSRDVYVEAKAGYLEDMFAGGGLQVLWRPDGGRFSFGADLYEVWQRDFDRLFGVQNYHVLTGHASIYYRSPWYGLNFAVHAGRYLAQDYGATFEVTRRFSTGVEIGAFATFTNVPFSKFGEGSFDKGIIIHIPLEWALPFYSHSAYDLWLRSITRDGGQRLDGDDSLYEETFPSSYGESAEHLDDITAP